MAGSVASARKAVARTVGGTGSSVSRSSRLEMRMPGNVLRASLAFAFSFSGSVGSRWSWANV
jgi:hypothetical protein